MKLFKEIKKLWGWLAYGLFLAVFCELSLNIYLIHFADSQRFKIFASRTMLDNRFKSTLIQPHFYLGYENTPSYKYLNNLHNSYGFRGKEIDKKKSDGLFRIVCIGGSTTYSTGVENYKHSYPHLLEKRINEAGIKAEVINAGVSGYNSLQSYINYLLKIEDLNPDMLIVYHAVNDLWARIVWPPQHYKGDQSGAFTVQSPNQSEFHRNLSIIRIPLIVAGIITPESSLQEIVKIQDTNFSKELETQLKNKSYPSGIFKKVSPDSMLRTNKPIFFESNLERLIKDAHSNEIEVVLSTFVYSKTHPTFVTELKLEAFQEGIAEHNAIIRKLSEIHDIPLLDLEKKFTPKDEWLTDGMHFTYIGNQKRVEKITDDLLPLIQEIKLR